jgi:hypothetical protein
LVYLIPYEEAEAKDLPDPVRVDIGGEVCSWDFGEFHDLEVGDEEHEVR